MSTVQTWHIVHSRQILVNIGHDYQNTDASCQRMSRRQRASLAGVAVASTQSGPITFGDAEGGAGLSGSGNLQL